MDNEYSGPLGEYYTVTETTNNYKLLMKRLYETNKKSGCALIKNGVLVEPIERLERPTTVGNLILLCFSNSIKPTSGTILLTGEITSADVEMISTLGINKVILLVDKENVDTYMINLLVNSGIAVEYVLTSYIVDNTVEGEQNVNKKQ